VGWVVLGFKFQVSCFKFQDVEQAAERQQDARASRFVSPLRGLFYGFGRGLFLGGLSMALKLET